jgi:hypothetical protein
MDTKTMFKKRDKKEKKKKDKKDKKHKIEQPVDSDDEELAPPQVDSSDAEEQKQ